MRPKGRAMAAFMVAVGLMLVILFRGYVVWKVLPAPWLGAFFIAFGTLAFIRPAILKRG